jgi:hypothetical protein
VDGLAETGYPFGLALASLLFRLPRFRVEAPVAQWIEYCPPKAGVAGSIPAGRTNSDKAFRPITSRKFKPEPKLGQLEGKSCCVTSQSRKVPCPWPPKPTGHAYRTARNFRSSSPRRQIARDRR